MINSILVSVIIVSFNGKRFLPNSIRTVLDQSLPLEQYEIIVVDNASVDGSANFVEDEFPGVQLIRLSNNLGFYGALNHIAPIARGKYIAATPQDTILHQRWLEEMVKVAETDDKIAMCLANTVNPPDPDYNQQERVDLTEYVYVVRSSIFGNHWIDRLPRKAVNRPVQLLFIAGVSELVRRAFLLENPYDLSFSHYSADMEFGTRINLFGYKIYLVPTSIVYHIDENKSAFDLKLLNRYFCGLRDRVLLYYKNMTMVEYLLFFPFLYLGIIQKALNLRINYIYRLVLLGVMFFVAPFVFLSAIPKLPKMRSERRIVQAKRQVDNLWLLKCLLGMTKIH